MRARWAVPAALAVVLACAPARAELRARTRDLGASSPVVSLLALEQGGSQDWGAGIPSPTIDCAASASGGQADCIGAPPTVVGNPTTVGSPFWRASETATDRAVRFDGSGDRIDLGSSGQFTTAATVCVDTRTNASGSQAIFSKDATGDRSWLVYYNAGFTQLAWSVINPAGQASEVVAQVPPSHWVRFCASYDGAPGDGAAIMRASSNGVASTAVTNGKAPAKTSSAKLLIGDRESGLPFTGDVHRATLWVGWTATQDELNAMTLRGWGMWRERPEAIVAHTRGDANPACCPFRDSECYALAAGAPCVHAPTYSGWAVSGGAEVFGPGANLLTYSETFANAAWAKSAGVSASDASASCPLGPTGVRMSLVTTDGDGDSISQDAATGTSRSVWLATATGDSACAVSMSDASGDGGQTLSVSASPTRQHQYGSDESGLSLASQPGGCARWCMWAAQSTATVDPQPYRASGATPYTYASGTAMAVAPVLNRPALNNRCRTVRACLRTWTGTDRTLWSEGLFAASQVNSARLRLFSNGALWYYINSAEGAQRTLAIAPKFVPGDCHSITACTSGGTQRIYLDRVLIAEGGTGGSGLFSAAPTTSDYIGTQNDASTPLQGVVSSAAVVGSSSIVRSYPYIPENVRVQVIGDSISAAYSVPAAYSVRLASLLGRPVDNYAQAGADTTTIKGLHRPTEGQSWLAVMGGINDVVGLDSAAGPILANLSAIVAAATSRGTSVVIMTLTPFHGNGTWTPGRQAVLEAVNAGIRGMGGGPVHVVDAYAAMGGADPTYLAEEWSHDGLHLNQAGTDRLADLVRGAMP